MMKRFVSFAVVLVFLLLLAGCGSSAANMGAPAPTMAAAAYAPEQKPADAGGAQKTSAQVSYGAEAPKGTADFSLASSAAGMDITDQSVTNAILAQRKEIRNANVTVEVDDFDVAYGKIKTAINAFGFVQEANIRTEKVYVDSKEKLVKKGTLVIRVDKLKFDDVLTGIRGLGLVVEENVSSEDVTEQYFDTDSQIRLLQYEQSRLEEYLKKITDPDTIFKTESRLTDIRHQIEGLTTTLRKWDDLVQLSTITINMNEKAAVSIVPQAKDTSYMGRLSDGFLGSFNGVLKFLGELVIFLAQALPVLVLLALLLILGIWIFRKYSKKKASPIAAKGEDETRPADKD